MAVGPAILNLYATLHERNEPMSSLGQPVTGWCVVAILLLLGFGHVPCASAVTIYSYIDDQSNLVYTDAPETIPDKYRPRVKTHERPDPVTPVPSLWQSVQRGLHFKAKDGGWKLPSFAMEGFTPNQSRIFTYAGGIGVVLIGCMFLSKSQFVRLLSLCLLLVLGIATPVLLYVNDGGPMDVMKKKAMTAGQAQQDRLQQMPR
jgi:hypothetical protein